MLRVHFHRLVQLLLLPVVLTSAGSSTSYYKLKSKTYDFVIVGSGPGGATVANYLSESGKYKVLVLEAGENRDADVPIYDSSYALTVPAEYVPEYFWQAVQQLNPFTEGDDQYTSGRLLGGGSSINGEQYVWPTAEGLAGLATYTGDDPDWSPEAIEKTLKDFEDLNGLPNLPYRGYKGQLNVRVQAASGSANKFVDAVTQYTSQGDYPDAPAGGYPAVNDYNDPATPVGPFASWQLTQLPNGDRASSSVCLLDEQEKARKNLVIKTRSTVLEIIFSSNKAKGVYYTDGGIASIALARKCVILAAGHHSSLILENSGVGDAELIGPYLEAIGKKVISDVPGVGAQLGNDGTVFFPLTRNPADPLAPSLNDIYAGGAFLPPPPGSGSGTTTSPRFSQWLNIDLNAKQFALGAILLDVTSRGFAHIQSGDPVYEPNVTTNAMYDDGDRARWTTLIVEQVQGIVNAMKAIDPAYDWDPNGNDFAAPFDPAWFNNGPDYPEIVAYFEAGYVHSHHWFETSKMAPLEEGGVVDNDGNVYGTKNLKVADASIVPIKPDGNTQVWAYLVGATIAKKILKEYGHEK